MTTKKTVAITAVISVAVTALVTSVVKDISFYTGSQATTLDSKLTLINTYLESDYIYDYDEDAMREMAVTGYVEGLDEPYTHYYDPQTFSS